TLGRALVAGEIVDVPLSITGTDVSTDDWALALKSGATLNTGVTLTGATTATPQLRFEGAAAETATLILTAQRDAVSESDETITVALGPDGTGTNGFDRTTLSTNVGGGANPAADAGDRTFDVVVSGNVGQPGVTISVTDDGVTEGSTSDEATFTVVLNTEPSTALLGVGFIAPPGLEIITPGLEDFTQFAATVFRQSTWDQPRTFRVRATEDSTDSPPGRELQIEWEIDDLPTFGEYRGLSGTAATVTVTDNDPTAVTLQGSRSDVTEGGTKTFTVMLGRGLVDGEILGVPLSFGGAATRNTDYTVACPTSLPTGVTCNDLNTASTPTVTFTGPQTGETATSVTLTLSATTDSMAETDGETVQIGLGTLDASSGMGLSGGARGTDNLDSFSIRDVGDDVPGVIISPAGTITIGEGGTSTFTVDLNSQPSRSVFIAITAPTGLSLDGPDSATEFTSSEDLTFTTETWNVPQTLTVRAPENDADDPGARALAVTYRTNSTDDDYRGLSGTATTVTVTDNDPTGVTLRVRGAATEGSSLYRAAIDLTLERGLVAGEVLAVPLDIAGGVLGTDYSLVLEPAAAGVSLSGETVTFTGPDTGATATRARVRLAALDDADDANETLTVSIPAASSGDAPVLVATGLEGGATGERSGDGEIVVTDNDVLPVAYVTAPSRVAEGETLGCAARVVPRPNGPLSLGLSVTQEGDVLAADVAGTRTLSLRRDARLVEYNGATLDDDMDEPDGVVTCALQTGTGYKLPAEGSARAASVSLRVTDNDPTPVTLAGTGGSVAEGASSTFTLSLGRGLVDGEILPVPLTFAGTAERGTDYMLSCPQTLPTGVTCNDLDTATTPTV
ncbi:MAG: hypothetical protein OXC25_15965, partial [Thiotrichales bacterium]|nr:hypothetical protein [Thiotrichales bacterium]